MSSTATNTPATGASARPRRRLWPWIVGILVLPLAAAALAVYGLIHLDRSASTLRSELMAATGGAWHPRVQVSVGPVLVSTVRAGLALVHDVPAEAREAMGALRSASVGVYERTAANDGLHLRPGFWSEADRVMARRGWTRVVRVRDRDSLVLVYVPAGRAGRRPSRACVAFCDGHRLVVVTAGFKPDRLAGFLVREINGRLDLGNGIRWPG